MPLSIFIDALPYTEITEKYSDWFSDMQIAELQPNIAYSSSLHWQLYCNKYPDERGVLVDWAKMPEKNKAVRFFATVLRPLDSMGDLGIYSRKFLDRYIFRANKFANIPYKFRKDFSENGKYLFWDEKTYRAEKIFNGYTVVSQDEGHISFEETVKKLENAIKNGDKNIFTAMGFTDQLGHKCRRGEIYHKRVKPYMAEMHRVISEYLKSNPAEEVIIISDHGMSTINEKVDLCLEKKFGKQSKKSYIAYSDSAVMCIWCGDEMLKKEIAEYLGSQSEGHLLTEEEREKYRAADRKFGDLIFNLREGYVFAESWFGKSLRKPSPDGAGMHGFWPELSAKDQMACILLINGRQRLEKLYDYPRANKLLEKIMQERNEKL